MNKHIHVHDYQEHFISLGYLRSYRMLAISIGVVAAYRTVVSDITRYILHGP